MPGTLDSIHQLACPDEKTLYLANLYASRLTNGRTTTRRELGRMTAGAGGNERGTDFRRGAATAAPRVDVHRSVDGRRRADSRIAGSIRSPSRSDLYAAAPRRLRFQARTRAEAEALAARACARS